MWSKYTTTSLTPCSRLSITRWKIHGADEIPNGKRVYWNNPLWVLTTTYSLESSSNGKVDFREIFSVAQPREHILHFRDWVSIQLETIPEKDSQHYLGILHSVSISTLLRTSERCSAGRTAYFRMNAIGDRFGCLHPATILRMYKIYCLPVFLYGSELWNITRTEFIMIERVQRKILRTILGVPVRCNSKALLHIMRYPQYQCLHPPETAELYPLLRVFTP